MTTRLQAYVVQEVLSGYLGGLEIEDPLGEFTNRLFRASQFKVWGGKNHV